LSPQGGKHAQKNGRYSPQNLKNMATCPRKASISLKNMATCPRRVDYELTYFKNERFAIKNGENVQK
jgi:hypothetical protein